MIYTCFVCPCAVKVCSPGERKTPQNGLSFFMTAQTYSMHFRVENNGSRQGVDSIKFEGGQIVDTLWSPLN